jgi:AcrR family transcriptional regulator
VLTTGLGSEDGLSETGGLSERQVHIVRSAYRLFADRGVERVPIHEIASAAGVSKSIVLYYFKTKEQLVGATMWWVLEEIGERIRHAVAGAATPVEAVETMIETIFLGPDQSRRFYLTYLDLIDHAARVSGFGQISAAFRATVNRVYAEVIGAGLADGTFRVREVDEAAVAVRAIVEGLHFQWLQEDDWRERHAWYRRACIDAVLAYLLNADSSRSEPVAPRRSRPAAVRAPVSRTGA